MPLVTSNTLILTPFFRPIWKVVNDSKSYVLRVPLIMSFKVLKYFLVAKQVSFYLLAYGKEIANRKNWFPPPPEIVTRATVSLMEKGLLLPEKCWFVAGSWLILEVNGLYKGYTHNFYIFSIKFYDWNYSKFSLEKLRLTWSVPIFCEKNICRK